MEVPSSSPVYTPLRAREPPPIDDIEPVTLDFDTIDGIDTSADEEDAPPSLDASPSETRSMTTLRQIGEIEDSQTWDKPLKLPDQKKRPQEKRPHVKRPQETLETIDIGDTDEELGSTTQTYFNELLTESVLESLPLPPPKRRQVAHLYDHEEVTLI